jgi:proteasome lid subunit RPN8/RPN11
MNINSRNGLIIPKSYYQMMLADVICRAPEEACGLVAGQMGYVSQVYIVTNELRSPTSFRMDAQEHIDAFLMMEKNGQELLAIYHSHPAGPESPSETDLAEFAYPGVITLIWFPKADGWACRAYRIKNGRADETTFDLVENV